MTPEQQRALASAAVAAAAAAAARSAVPQAPMPAPSTVPGPGLSQATIAPATGGPLPHMANGQVSGVNVRPGATSVLPFSWDQTGSVRFDPSAGLLGGIMGGATLPHDVYAGKVDPFSQEGIQRAAQLATMITPTAAGDLPISGSTFRAKPDLNPPTTDQLRAASSAGYDSARSMGVDYSSDAVAKVAAAVRARMESDGILGELAPKTFGVLDKLSTPPPDSVAPFTSLEAARRAAGRAGRDFTNPTEQEASHRLVDAIDQFVSKPDPGDIVAGPAALVGQTVGDARGNYAAAARSDTVNGIEEGADLRAGATGSGLNFDNTTRQRVASLLLSPKQLAGFSPDEVALLTEVAKGTATRNTIRYVGNLLGGGGGAGVLASALAGSLISGEKGAAVAAVAPAMGYAARKVANAMTRQSIGNVDEAVRMRSPLYQKMITDAPMVPLSTSARAAVARALLEAQMRGAPMNAAAQPTTAGNATY